MSTREAWQAQADLLAEGREVLERQCSTTRYRHLFPTGPNMALLFRAYQELDRWRTVRHRSNQTPRGRRRERRRFHRLLKRFVREDAIARDRRLLWQYPLPRPQRLGANPPKLVLEALAEVDLDARVGVSAHVHGRTVEGPSGSLTAVSLPGAGRVDPRVKRGLIQFNEALINSALSQPDQIPRLHPQYLQFMASPQPLRRKHPIATMLLVKLPLQLLMIIVLLFNLAYLGAYHFFNDERLGDFLTAKIGGMIDGDLIFGNVHWSPMLIVDLFTGQPHTLHGYDLEVYEAYKIDGLERGNRTAYAEHVEVEIVIHEIIPWNRLGVPGMLEIPWVLHFEDIHNHGDLWVDIRAYQDRHRDGEWMLSLINAFDVYTDLHPPPELKKLSFRIDRAHFDGLVLDLDLEERSGWSTRLTFDQITVGLDYEGWAPIDYQHLPGHKPEVLPLRYEASASNAHGEFVISNIHDGPMSIENMTRLEIASGMNYRPIGDLWVSGAADLGGSPSVFEGRLLDVFGDLRFDFSLGTTNAGPIASVIMPPEPDDTGRMRSMILAEGSPANLSATGPVDDVTLQAVGQGLTLDLFPESAWTLDDVDVSLTLARDPRPETWATVLDGPDPELPVEDPDLDPWDEDDPDHDHGVHEVGADDGDEDEERDDGQRWIVYLDTFRGSALDGSVRLHRRAGQDHIVLPEPEEPMLVSIYLDMLGVNLAQLVPDDPDLGAMLQGETKGGLQIHRVVLDGGLERVEAELHRVSIVRDRGPADDHLPRNIRASGEVIYDVTEGIDLRGLRIGVDGGQLRATGGVDAGFESLRPTTASIRVDNGEAFLRAFGLPRWFDSLSIDFGASGPLSAPRGSGTLDIAGAGAAALAVDDIQAASLEFRRGTLSLRSPKVHMLGGRGPLDADFVLFGPDGEALADPKLRLALRLEDINREDILGSGIGAKDATIELLLDDGSKDKRPVPLSRIQARGGAYADTLSLAGVDYRNAEASFALTRDGIEIDRMNLAYHRPVSPALSPSASVPIGRVEVTGTVGFDDDPALELTAKAINLPLSAIAESLEVELPIRGQISRGSELDIRGSLRRPDIHGRLVLAQLGAAGIPLGGGVLQLASEDIPYQAADVELGRAATGAHRRVQISGSLSDTEMRSSEDDGDQLDWRIDATIAFGGGSENPIEAAADLLFANLPLDTLLAHPSRAQWRSSIEGGLHELEVETRYCPSHEGDRIPLLTACAEVDPNDPRHLAGEPLRVDLSLAHLWYRGRQHTGGISGGDPCFDSSTTCSLNPLVARLEGDQLSLAAPWRIRSGGKQGPELIIDGSVDISGEDEEDEEDEFEASASQHRCVPGIPDNASLARGQSAATIDGALDFSAISPFLGQLGVGSPVGRLDIDLELSGVVTQPTLTGYVRIPEDQPIELDLADADLDERGRRRTRPIPVEVSTLNLRMAGGTVYIDGAVEVYDEVIKFGEVNNRSTYLDLAGPCSGRFALSAAGRLDGALLRRAAPDVVESSGGAIDVRDFHVAGDLARFGEDETPPLTQPDGTPKLAATDNPFEFSVPMLDSLSGTLSLERTAIRTTVSNLGEVRLASGIIEVQQCSYARPCGPKGEQRRTRGIGIWVAGRRSAKSKGKPSSALTLRLGDRGRTDIWGELILADSLDGDLADQIQNATFTISASNFPISLTDNSGRTELEASLSSERIRFETDGVDGRISGEVLVDRSSWVRDARQGVAVLSFADPTPTPPSQLPEFIRRLELEVELRTGSPFRIDNNVAKQLEATASLSLGGTVGSPDMSGTIDVERGVVDVDILGGAYDVTRGRVIVNHDISQSSIQLTAARQKQIKINNQLLTLNLRLAGTLDAIMWECFAPGDTSGALSTARGCVDYLIFDAGNTDLASSGIRESRNNNLLGTRFLPLAGRLTQVELNEVLEREVPRVANTLPYLNFRIDQLGVVMEAETRPEWLRWGWGRLGLNVQYTRGYPGSVIRDSRSFSGRLEILENAAIEAAFGLRNYTNRVLIVDPPNYRSIQTRIHGEVNSRL